MQIDARYALQLALGARHHHTKSGTQSGHICHAQILHRVNAIGRQLLGALSPYPPHFAHIDLRQQFVLLRWRECVVIENTLRTRVYLGHMVGQLGQGFGGANADAHGYAGPRHHPFAQLVAELFQTRHAS